MSELEEQLSRILSDPGMMQTIQGLAQSLGQEAPRETPGSIDPGMLQAVTGLMGKAGISSQQKALLSALSPYIHADRLNRLEHAMRSAQMAKLALGLMGSNSEPGR